MLGDVQAAAREHEAGRGRHVDRVRTVAARSARIDDEFEVVLDVKAARAHRLGRAENFRRRLALGRQRRKKPAGLHGRPFRVHDRADRIRHLLGVEILSGYQRPQQRTKIGRRAHGFAASAMKLVKMRWPSGVKTDSGWNCTP